ncbi:unnamed protein product, partial [Strongylus vulgaris]
DIPKDSGPGTEDEDSTALDFEIVDIDEGASISSDQYEIDA